MRLTSCAASLARSRMRCGVVRIGSNRRTWPTGWPCAVGNWLRVSWSTSPTSLISWAARPASARRRPGLFAAAAIAGPTSVRGPEVYRAGVPVLGGAFKTPRKQIMPSAPGLGGQVGRVGPGEVQGGGDLRGDRDAQAGQLSTLVGVVAQQRDAVGAQRVQHLGCAGVVALVGPVTERE